jgi:polyisoprenoid-binding protein YceI
MKKYLIIIYIIISGFNFSINAQKILVSKSSEISFFSKTPVKDIDAENKASTALINLDTKDIAIKIPVKSFIFPNKLMQEHFNENYLETEKYPSSTFRGKINEPIDLNKDGKINVTATGKINIHGVEKTQTFKGTATVSDKKVTLDSQFDIALADFKIDIPKIVFEEIAEKVKVTFKILFEEKK